MKKISLLALAFSFTTSLVSAEEITLIPAALAPVETCPCPKAFQGFYAGGNFGYGIGSVGQSNQTPRLGINPWDKTKIAAQGFDGGLLIGYNYVTSSKYAFGLEAYINWASTQGRHSGLINATVPFAVNVSLKNAVQVRVPISYVICDLIAPKIVMGWDNSGWSTVINLNQGQLTKSNTSRYNGFLWGFGVDFLLAKHIISGIEYTGVVSQTVKLKDQQTGANTFSIFPLYNTIKATLKFIY